jgi:putative ATPase
LSHSGSLFTPCLHDHAPAAARFSPTELTAKRCSMDLFDANRERLLSQRAPLADRMRPRTLDELVGQEHLVGEGTLLRRAIEQDRISSLILWGPPGSGKTTLARIIARTTKARFVQLSAVSAGVADLRREVKEATEQLGMHGIRTILFIDEIHRFNKAQQDAILPYVEDGTLVLIGATTENPSFEVNAPLLSRSRVLVLQALPDDAIRTLVERTLADTERGLGESNISIDTDALHLLVNMANGDARFALNTLELAAVGVEDGRIGLDLVKEAAAMRMAGYDRAGDAHYDTISALHKSIRGSDPNATLYWLARMLERGDDPLFVARRLVRAASEDVGLADPQALQVTMAAQQAIHFLGMPEGALALAEAAVYLATAPKSNAIYKAYGQAVEDVRQTRNEPIPIHLRNAPTKLMAELGYGENYRYAHDYPDALVEQQHMPSNLKGRRYYKPTDRGYEQRVAERLQEWRRILIERRREGREEGEHA